MAKTAVVNINIVTGDPRPIFRQIVEGLRMEIACGNLPVGAKLPSVRGLAMQLTINANTVAKAYSELTTQGLLEARQGLGLFVAQPKQRLNQDEQEKQLGSAIEKFVNDIAYLDFDKKDLLNRIEESISKLSHKRDED
ncbi:GntR family transcriptional regulator [Alteromonadaceae bacterium M269]|nr:GntR family transcriptional regulator [Alteromonadaceae bacterium M269]